jgi:hypothetical protein
MSAGALTAVCSREVAKNVTLEQGARRKVGAGLCVVPCFNQGSPQRTTRPKRH